MTNMSGGELTDPDLAAEIELLSELIVVASEAEGALDERTIDLVLGVRPSAHGARIPRQGRASRRSTPERAG